jgi:hypothetical protein
MARGLKLTEYEKGRIGGLKSNSMSNRQVAKLINRSLVLLITTLKTPVNMAKNSEKDALKN